MTEAVVIVDNLTRVEGLGAKLREFLGFAGTITKLTVHKNEGKDTVHAVVTFSTSGAARTAILMNNTPFNGSNITVKNVPADFKVPETDDADERPAVEVPKEEPALPANSPEAIFNDIVKQGLALTQTALEQAKALDEQHHISATLTAVGEQVAQQAQAKFSEIDKELNLTTKAAELGQQIEATFTALDEQYKIKETAQTTATATETAFVGLASQATQVVGQLSEDPKVKEGVASLEAWGQATGQTIQQAVEAAIASTKK